MKGNKMKFLQALVVFWVAVPFIYMAYDVIKFLYKESIGFMKTQAKPLYIQLINLAIKN
jgi:hypothetical protein